MQPAVAPQQNPRATRDPIMIQNVSHPPRPQEYEPYSQLHTNRVLISLAPLSYTSL